LAVLQATRADGKSRLSAGESTWSAVSSDSNAVSVVERSNGWVAGIGSKIEYTATTAPR
jgi:hypothetical protein